MVESLNDDILWLFYPKSVYCIWCIFYIKSFTFKCCILQNLVRFCMIWSSSPNHRPLTFWPAPAAPHQWRLDDVNEQTSSLKSRWSWQSPAAQGRINQKTMEVGRNQTKMRMFACFFCKTRLTWMSFFTVWNHHLFPCLLKTKGFLVSFWTINQFSHPNIYTIAPRAAVHIEQRSDRSWESPEPSVRNLKRTIPIPSIYGIFTLHLPWRSTIHVGKYTIHGWYGMVGTQ